MSDVTIGMHDVSNAKLSDNKLPVYVIVIMVLLVLVILCGAAGIVYYMSIKKGNHSDPDSTVAIPTSAAPHQPMGEINGRASAVYGDIEELSNYQALYT